MKFLKQDRRSIMSQSKYKININDLEKRHNVAKLERDGFTRSQIIDAVYKNTDGAPQNVRTEMVNRLFDRGQK